MKYFYEKNTELLESDSNKKFEEILTMTKDEFREWAIQLRKTIVSLWISNLNIKDLVPTHRLYARF
jgi:succinate dehydrogenase flavin-adding protein (antitoxin of CptAB toxin-antitoxin module)